MLYAPLAKLCCGTEIIVKFHFESSERFLFIQHTSLFDILFIFLDFFPTFLREKIRIQTFFHSPHALPLLLCTSHHNINVFEHRCWLNISIGYYCVCSFVQKNIIPLKTYHTASSEWKEKKASKMRFSEMNEEKKKRRTEGSFLFHQYSNNAYYGFVKWKKNTHFRFH